MMWRYLALELILIIKYISFIDAYCEPPWQPMNGHCYKHVKTAANWFTAKSACQNEQSSLTTLSSLGEAFDVYDMVNDNGGCYIWIGYHDNDVEGQWVWVDPTEHTSFEDWYGAPGYDTSKNCVLSDCDLHHYWIDEVCSDAYGYVCEKDQLPWPRMTTSASEQTTVSVGANRATTDVMVTTQPTATTMEIHFPPATTQLPEINDEDDQRQVFRSALARKYECMRENEDSTENSGNYLTLFRTRSFSRCIMECRYLNNCTAVKIHQNECSLLLGPDGLDMTKLIYLVYKLA
ncbi:C-type lectin galactose-binding isoform-like [Anneissia japonica]|uniref:C-type lectin galactose-binding isoform-like n=1 Tax=Anneissia japonica TaxID=1529436 RepID=UPI001425BAE5|nr:C-type lectin galactose-binding isoform-like [Anneissia japonica]